MQCLSDSTVAVAPGNNVQFICVLLAFFFLYSTKALAAQGTLRIWNRGICAFNSFISFAAEWARKPFQFTLPSVRGKSLFICIIGGLLHLKWTFRGRKLRVYKGCLLRLKGGKVFTVIYILLLKWTLRGRKLRMYNGCSLRLKGGKILTVIHILLLKWTLRGRKLRMYNS